MTEQRFIDIEEGLGELNERMEVLEEAVKVFLSKKLKDKVHLCEACGNEFYARKGAKYCTNSCRQYAYHVRKKWDA